MTNEIGKILRLYRLKNDIPMKAMAMEIGISANHLSTLETSDRIIPKKYIDKMDELYGIKSTSMYQTYRNRILKIQAEKILKEHSEIYGVKETLKAVKEILRR